MRVFSIIRKSRSFQGFRFEFNSIRYVYEHEIINAFPLSFSVFLTPTHADTHTYTARRRKLLANANSHTGIALFRLRVGGPRDEGRGGAQDSWFAFAYSSAVLPSTFPATHPPWNSAGTRWCGCMHSLRGMERGGPRDGTGRGHGTGRGQQPCISSLDS